MKWKGFLKDAFSSVIGRAFLRYEEKERAKWEYEQKRLFKECGKFVRLNGKSSIAGHDKIVFGNNVHIGTNAYIRGEGGLKIGDNTHISRNLLLYTIDHNLEGKRLPGDEVLIEKPVYIGRNVSIGMNVNIAPGTTINDGCIIGMGVTLAGNIPEFAVVVGSPHRIVKYRDAEHYRKLDALKSYGGIGGYPIPKKYR